MREAVNQYGFISVEDMCMWFFVFWGFFFGGIEKVWKELPQNINRYLGIVEFQMTFLLLLILSTINLHVLVIVKGQAAKRSTILRLKEMNFSLI